MVITEADVAVATVVLLALLRVPGAANVEPEGYNGIHTDSRGYAVMPTLSAYRRWE